MGEVLRSWTMPTNGSHPGSRPSPSAVVVSRYNETVTSVMLDGAVGAYLARGGSDSELAVLESPGAYELISIARAAASSGMYGSVVCLGCVIKGETSHDLHISSAVANGLAQITVATGVPVAFGVLTTNTNEQALARAGGDKGNKGAEAMNAALDAADAVAMLARAKAANTPSVRFTPGLSPNDKLTAYAQENK
jgi:6,7-dimethyl-8-ribityllumazine synthase